MRLRGTEPPASFDATAMPKRGCPSSLKRAVTAKNPFPMRRPRACTASNSGFRRKRRCAGRVSRPGDSRPELKGLVQWPAMSASERACARSTGNTFKERACDGPWNDGGPAPCDRSSWPCARESPSRAYGAACSVDTYASWSDRLREWPTQTVGLKRAASVSSDPEPVNTESFSIRVQSV